MKCISCGGNLSLEDVVCPYCDALNEHAVDHIREMNRYKREFEGTRQEVYSVTKGYAGISVRAIIGVVLVILIALSAFLVEESYSIKRSIMEGKASRNVEEYKEIMEQYLEDRDYYAFSMFCSEKCIETYDTAYEEYADIIYASNYYRYVYGNIMQLFNPYSDSYYNDTVQRLSEHLDYFYKVWDEEGYNYVGDSEKDRRVIEEMQEQIHALLVTYCGLTQEDLVTLPGMSRGKRAVLIEERLSHAE